jgi:hypothetical protein
MSRLAAVHGPLMSIVGAVTHRSVLAVIVAAGLVPASPVRATPKTDGTYGSPSLVGLLGLYERTWDSTFLDPGPASDGRGFVVFGETYVQRQDTTGPYSGPLGLQVEGDVIVMASTHADLVPLPDTWVAVLRILYVWNGADWQVCQQDADWDYDTSGTLTRTDHYGSGPCGAGYYGVISYLFGWDGTVWRGGGLWSGYLYSS